MQAALESERGFSGKTFSSTVEKAAGGVKEGRSYVSPPNAKLGEIIAAYLANWTQTLPAMPTIATSLSLVAVVCLLSGQIAGQLSPNADSTYVQLRNVALQPQSVTVDKITLKRDAATFQLNSGTICFLNPVRDKVTGAVFVGEGKLLINPPLPSEQASLSVLTPEKRSITRASINLYCASPTTPT